MKDAQPASDRYWLNRALFDLGDPARRAAFAAGPEVHFDAYPLDDAEKQALLGRNWCALLKLGALPGLVFKYYMVLGLPPEKFAASMKEEEHG